MSSTYTDKDKPCFQRTNSHCKFDFFFIIQVWIKLLDIIVLTTVLLKHDHTDSAREEQLDLPYLIMISVICVLEDVSIRLDILTSEFSAILEHLPVLSGYMQILHQVLVFTICNFCNYNHDFRHSHLWCRRSLLCEYNISVWVIFYNVITEFHLCTSDFFISTEHFSSDMFSSLKTSLLCLCTSRMTSFLIAVPHGLIDTFIPMFFFFPVNDSFITDTDLGPSFLDLTEWENTLVLETLSRSHCQKHFLSEPKYRGYRASCWLATAASGFLIRDLLWNAQWYSFLVIVHLIEDRRGIRLVIEADIELLICVWDLVDQSDLLWVERQWAFDSIRERMKRKTKRKEMWSRKTRKYAHQYQGVTWQRGSKMTDLCTWLMTWAIRSAHEKKVRVVRVWWDALFTETGVLAWGFSRFSDALSCNGFLRPYLSFCFWFEFECLTVISKFQGSRTGIPSIRKFVSRKIISESVELWDTHVCFLHIQLIGKTCDFRIRTMFHLEPISNLRDLLQCQNLETVTIWIVGLYFPHDNVIHIHIYDEYKRSNVLDVWHMLWPILWLHV